MNKIYYHSNEFFLLRDVPEEINEPMCVPQVKKEIEACIAAKTRIDNPELLKSIRWNYTFEFWEGRQRKLLNGDIFDLPDNVEFEEGIKIHSNPNGGKRTHEKVIHLKLKQEVKEESQDELLIRSNSDIITLYQTLRNYFITTVDNLKDVC